MGVGDFFAGSWLVWDATSFLECAWTVRDEWRDWNLGLGMEVCSNCIAILILQLMPRSSASSSFLGA